MTPLAIDLAGTPFSRRGSYFAISELTGPDHPGVHLRTVRGDARDREIVRFDVGGHPSITVRPGVLSLSRGDNRTEVARPAAAAPSCVSPAR